MRRKNWMLLYIGLVLSPALFAQDYAVKQLEYSPRHHEWVELESGNRKISCFLAYAEFYKNTQAVILIHENRGLNDWARSAADQLAALGYLVIAPDLLSDFEEGKHTTSDFANSDDARTALYKLDPDQITRDLDVVYEYVKNLPSSNGEVSVLGFCWGGSQSFRYATNNPNLKAALVFYGNGPTDEESLAHIQCPVYGFYGEDDQRVNATIEPTAALMAKTGKKYEYVIYKGAGHAFMRRGDDPAEPEKANKKARKAAWKRVTKILK
jgi:carboxymethylenebutenolidase